MISVWIDGPHQDAIAEAKTDIIFPGLRSRRARVLDVLNGTEQELDVVANASSTIVKGLSVKDYPVVS